jgi:hypothetical protein
MVKGNETPRWGGEERGLNPGQQSCPSEAVFGRPNLQFALHEEMQGWTLPEDLRE